MNTNGDETPALPAIRAGMKMTPVGGGENGHDIAIAVGRPSAVCLSRLSWLDSDPAGSTIADMVDTSGRGTHGGSISVRAVFHADCNASLHARMCIDVKSMFRLYIGGGRRCYAPVRRDD